MGTTDDPMSAAYVDVNRFQGDEGSYGPGGLVLQQQWVTLTASMWPKPTASPRGWRIPSDRLPLLAAVFCGAALVVCVIFAFIVYRCCIMPKKEKHYLGQSNTLRRKVTPVYGMRKVEATTTPPPNPQLSTQNGLPSYPSQSAVYAEPKGHNWGYTNRIVAANSGSNWYQGNQQNLAGQQCTHCPGICPVPRSSSAPGSSGQISNISTIRKQRPVSQPIGLVINNGLMPKQIPMPEISEFSPQATQYASSSILDEVGIKDDGSPTTILKTRSLPAWVRSKPRPLSTEDDLNDLYAKVNFSKKRKNRMRNDEAAIIALSKSRSQFLHKDTDSLVDNEAVIVYDERTAL